jgi:hypothetical protein
VQTPVHAVRLEHGRGIETVWLRDLCGVDEQTVEDGGTAGAVALVERLLVEAPGGDTVPTAASLVASDREALLAAVYRRTFGDAVRATATCAGCGSPFDVDFSLTDLERTLRDDRPTVAVRPDGDALVLPDGTRFRLPTGADECAVAAIAPERAESELRSRLVLDGDAAAAEDAMAALAPLVEHDLEVACPECGATQTARFELASYLLGALAGELGQLAREVHTLAVAYGWGLDEILALSRRRRRAYVELASGSATAARRRL